MDVNDFSHTLCQLSTAIEKYLKNKKARELMKSSGRSMCLPDEIIYFIDEVLDEKTRVYEKQIIELATKLTQKSKE